MTSFRRYGSFFLLAMALGIASGPDILFVFAQSLAQGQAAGSLVTLGLCTGLVFHVSLAAFGIAAVLRRKPHLFKAITWCGAAYLVWLGVGAWRSAVVPVGESTAETMPYLRLYLRGIVMNVCNPKVMLFFLALMPRFVVPERGRVTAQFLLLGLTFAAATLLVFNLLDHPRGGRRRCAVGVSVALAGVAGVSAALLGNRHVWFGGLDRLDESAQGRVSPYGALAVSVRTPSLSEMTRMANSDGLNGESVETAAYANAPRRSV